MIIRSLQIENFGHFHNYRLDGLGFGVNPIIGENEFGKTTLLEFIRRIFWGFQVRRNSDLNPYPALDGSGLYGGRITLELSTGKRIEVERLGPKNGRLKLTRADGSVTEDETELQKLLDVSRTFYTNVYAITLDELHALTFLNDEEIRTRLYGAGLAQGDLSLPKLGAAFDRQAAALFQARGKKNRIAVLATELTALQQNFSAAEQQLPAFEAARQRAVDAKARIASLRAEGVRTAAELRREEQLAGGAERFQILQRRLEERERLPALPPDFAAGATTEFARLKAELSRATDRLAIRLERHDILKQQEATQNIFTIVMSSIAGISLLVGGIGIMNIMLANVYERRKEIGTRRALGAQKGDIIKQFLFETIFLTSLGGGTGVALGVFIAKMVTLYADMPTAFSIWFIVLALVISAVIGVLFGTYPAWKAAQQNPIEVLRSE